MREYYISIYRFYMQHELSCLRLKYPTGDLIRNISWLDKLCFDTRDLGELPTAQSVGADVGCWCVDVDVDVFFQSLGFGRLGLVNKVREIPVQNLEKKVSQKQTPFRNSTPRN